MSLRELTEDWRGSAVLLRTSTSDRPVAKPGTAFNDDTVTELLDDIDARISSRILRRLAVLRRPAVAGSDDEITEPERALLSEIAVRFG
jgi:hypothetical protein